MIHLKGLLVSIEAAQTRLGKLPPTPLSLAHRWAQALGVLLLLQRPDPSHAANGAAQLHKLVMKTTPLRQLNKKSGPMGQEKSKPLELGPLTQAPEH